MKRDTMFKGFIVVMLAASAAAYLSSCSLESSDDHGSAESRRIEVPLSASLVTAFEKYEGKMSIDVLVDASTVLEQSIPLADLEIDNEAVPPVMRGNLAIQLRVGKHTLELVYRQADVDFGSVELARSAQITVTVGAGSNNEADFLESLLTYSDPDDDGVPSIFELKKRTDPHNGKSFPVLDPPVGVTATASLGNIKLEWNPVAGAASYKIYRGTSAGVTTGDPATEVQSTIVNFDDVINGQTYYFRVSTVNAAGEGDLSGEIFATPGEPDLLAPVTTAAPAGASGPFNDAVTVTLACTDGASGCASTFYTLDGSNPTTDSLVYTAPVVILSTTTLKFFSVDRVGNMENIVTESYEITVDLAPPVTTASPAASAGPFNGTQSVQLNCMDVGFSGCAKTYYTVDGSEPSLTSSVYGSALNIASTTTLKYFSVDNSGNAETPRTDHYIIDSAPPTTTPSPTAAAGPFNSNQTIKLTCVDAGDAGCSVTYYTTDGSTPSTGSTKYSAAITITASTSLKYFSVDNAGNPETVKTQSYVIDKIAPTTRANPAAAAGPFSSGQSITLICTDSGAAGCSATYYTADGSTPTISSTKYSAPFSIGASTTLKYFSVDAAGNPESINTENYVIDTVAPTTSASPPAANGPFLGPQSVTLICSDSGSGCAATYYTTNGSTPTTASAKYGSAIAISVNTTLKYFSVDNAGNAETVKTQSYVIRINTVTNVVFSPMSPELMDLDQRVETTFDYVTDEAGGVLIWTTPIGLAGVGACGSSTYPVGTGKGTCFFTARSAAVTSAQTTSVQVRMTNLDQSVVLREYTLPVDFSWASRPNVISNVTFDPPTPASLIVGSKVNVNLSYKTNAAAGVRIWATGTNGICGSPLYATGTGIATGCVIGDTPLTLTQIKVFMVADDNTAIELANHLYQVNYVFNVAAQGVQSGDSSVPAAAPLAIFDSAITGSAVPPSIVAVMPRHSSSHVALDSPVRILFDPLMVPPVIDGNKLYLLDEYGARVNGQLSLDGATLIFVPDGGLRSNQVYSVFFHDGTANATGNEVVPTYSWRFNTYLTADAEYTVNISNIDGAVLGYVGGAFPDRTLMVQQSAQEAILEFDITRIPSQISRANLQFSTVPISNNTAHPMLHIYGFDADGQPSLGTDYSSADLLYSIEVGDQSGEVMHSLPVTELVRSAKMRGLTHIGIKLSVDGAGAHFQIPDSGMQAPPVTVPHIDIE